MSQTQQETGECRDVDILRIQYRTLESGECDWTFQVWNADANRYDDVRDGRAYCRQYAPIGAFRSVQEWATDKCWQTEEGESG